MTDYTPEHLADEPLPVGDPTPVVTATPVVMGVVISLGVAVVAVIIASAWLAAVGAPELPGAITAIGTASVGALAALLAGTLTRKA